MYVIKLLILHTIYNYLNHVASFESPVKLEKQQKNDLNSFTTAKNMIPNS